MTRARKVVRHPLPLDTLELSLLHHAYGYGRARVTWRNTVFAARLIDKGYLVSMPSAMVGITELGRQRLLDPGSMGRKRKGVGRG